MEETKSKRYVRVRARVRVCVGGHILICTSLVNVYFCLGANPSVAGCGHIGGSSYKGAQIRVWLAMPRKLWAADNVTNICYDPWII